MRGKLILGLILAIGIGLYFFCNVLLQRKFEKLVLVIGGREEGIIVEVYDFYRLETLKIIIPNQTEVRLAQNLGIMRLGSVWKLGQDNGAGGRLLAETVALNWHWPVNAWGDYSYGDRLLLSLFRLKLKPNHQSLVDLSQSGDLTLSQLADGTLGYQLNNRGGSGQLLGAFVFKRLEEMNWKVQIVNASGSREAGGRLGEIVHNMGLQVAFVDQVSPEDYTCRIASKNAGPARIINGVLGCSLVQSGMKEGFEMTIYLGRNHFLNSR